MNRLWMVCCSAAALAICASAAVGQGWTVTQLTANTYDDCYPQVSGNTVVWRGSDGHDNEIFLWDGMAIQQLTDNDDGDGNARISGSNVLWRDEQDGWGELFLHDGTATTRLTDNIATEYDPVVSGDNVVWYGDWSGGRDVFLYDHSAGTTTQISAGPYRVYGAQVSGDNVVWAGYDDPGTDVEIFLYNHGTGVTSQLTKDDTNQSSPQVSGDYVAWQSGASVFLYDGATTTLVTDSARALRGLSGSNVIWTDSHDMDEIFMYDGTSSRQITDNSYAYSQSQIFGDRVVYAGMYASDSYEVMVYDNGTGETTSLNRGAGRPYAQIWNDAVVWQGRSGGNYEIYIGQYSSPTSPGGDDSPEPATWLLLACTGIAGAIRSRKRNK